MAEEKTQISIRVPASVIEKFDRIATGTDRDRSYVMNQAFLAYLEAEGGELLEEMDGFARLDAGEGVDADEMIAKARAIVSDARSRKAG